jgi:hypothetical protein
MDGRKPDNTKARLELVYGLDAGLQVEWAEPLDDPMELALADPKPPSLDVVNERFKGARLTYHFDGTKADYLLREVTFCGRGQGGPINLKITATSLAHGRQAELTALYSTEGLEIVKADPDPAAERKAIQVERLTKAGRRMNLKTGTPV